MIVFTAHAEMRYQQRIPNRIPLPQLVLTGRIQNQAPGALTISVMADAYLVHGEAIFPLRRGPKGDYAAVTCLRRKRPTKAERRARRDAAYDQDFDIYWPQEAV